MFRLDLSVCARVLLQINEEFRFLTGRSPAEFTLNVFSQVWGSTAGGFCGIGGDAMTQMETYVFLSNTDDLAYVFFENRFAYSVRVTDSFRQDLMHRNLKGCWECKKYYEVVKVVME